MASLKFFGGFQLKTSTGEAVSFPVKSSAAILVVLGLKRTRKVHRAELAAILWPDQLAESQRTNLRQALRRAKMILEMHPALPVDLLVVEGEFLSLRVDGVQTDIERGEELYREYLSDPESDAGMKSLDAYWSSHRPELLPEFNLPWFDSLRTRYRLLADELGVELAHQYQAMGKNREALRVWKSILEDSPNHVDALKNLIQLETQLNGREAALPVLQQVLVNFGDVGSDHLPLELMGVMNQLRQPALAPIPRPEMVQKRGPILLLVQLFERNLRNGGQESLHLLAAELNSEFARSHPKVLLNLCDTALRNSSGSSDVRVKILVAAVRLASYCSEYDTGHHWADALFKDSSLPIEVRGEALRLKAFMYFEQRDYATSEQWFGLALETMERSDNAPLLQRCRATYAGLKWHAGRYGEAERDYLKLVEVAQSDGQDASSEHVEMAHGNMCFMLAMQGKWQQSYEYGVKMSATVGMYSEIISAPFGAAMVHIGLVKDGVELLSQGLTRSHSKGLKRFHQIAVDFGAVCIAHLGDLSGAQTILDANWIHRRAMNHDRSPAECDLVATSGGLFSGAPTGARAESTFLNQPSSLLSQITVEWLQRVG